LHDDTHHLGPIGPKNATWSDGPILSGPTLTLDGLDEVTVGGDAAALRLGGLLGVGGTARVRGAHETSLRREVAVKEIRPGRDTTELRAQMIREAIVMGRLEHPNIVPVHRLGADRDGRPLLVMKRVEGVPWEDVIAAPEAHRHLLDDQDALLFHLNVLREVCQAVAFAHSRDVLHRDIKPANVMIGEFGQVYLMDWGAAVALRDHPGRVLPLARHVRRIVGTPGYLAPEMARADGAALSERTDVYLLGATLYEALTGRPPHRRKGLQDSLQDSLQCRPLRFEDDVPDELAQICRRATAAHPPDRFCSARLLGEALARFVEHRASVALSTEALGPAAAHQDFQSRRYALTHALRLWGGNHAARAGLRTLLTDRIEAALDGDDPGTAEGLLAELQHPPTALVQRTAQLRERRRGREEELASLRASTDPRPEARMRAQLWAGMAGVHLSTFWTLQLGVELGWWPFDHRLLFVSVAITLTYVLGWRRLATLQAPLHDRIVRTGMVRLVATPVLFAVGWAIGLPPAQTLLLHLLLMVYHLWMARITLGREVVDPASIVPYLLGACLLGVLPDWGLTVYGTSLAASAASLSWSNVRLHRTMEPPG
jgi:eukaryotic-like serine/threonine-protein kinase